MKKNTCGRYILSKEIGRGASGIVYMGLDPLIDRVLAIKTIHYQDIDKTDEKYQKFLKRFYREAQATGALSHPNIVTVFDVGEDEGIPFIGMEFVEGMTLTQYMKTHSLLDERLIVPVLRKIASALDYAHTQGVIHRDVKPSNVMYASDGNIKVVDFSIARLESTDMGTITSKGMVLGTPYYMPPEQIKSISVTNTSDIYSLAVVAYEIMAGQVPFSGKSLASIMYKVLHEPPKRNEKIDAIQKEADAFERVFLRALAKDGAGRFPTAKEFVDELIACYDVGTDEKKKVQRKVSDFAGQKTVLLMNVPTPKSLHDMGHDKQKAKSIASIVDPEDTPDPRSRSRTGERSLSTDSSHLRNVNKKPSDPPAKEEPPPELKTLNYKRSNKSRWLVLFMVLLIALGLGLYWFFNLYR